MDLKEVSSSGHPHPWELCRSFIVENIIRYEKVATILDVGCGDAFIMDHLQKRFSLKAIGVDLNYTGDRKEIVRKISESPLKSFDVVLMMDVLEHVTSPLNLFLEASSFLKKEGLCIVTVPAFKHLFSEHDIFLNHLHRYTLKQLHQDINLKEFEVIDSHYFLTSLYLVRLLQKFLGIRKANINWAYKEKNLVTIILKSLFISDYFICRIFSKIGVNLPGLSCILVLRKRI
jgi:2-polyprenyl-3-methyl-5-hydroxy-6-metoxy-1,4-benzoquinol methylase